ncbi:MAG: hypothetical protein RLZZ437_176 [Pseudomonadota bacterium]
MAAGVNDLETNTPATAQQTFEIGSQTKLMTSVAILQLAEQGKINLDAKAADYLSAGTIEGIANADTVTVRQLPNMTSGIDNYTEVRDAEGVPLFIRALLENPYEVFGPQQALDLARGLPAVSAPGAEYFYTNTNYLLLGQIIEQQTGKEFFGVLKAGICDPAGMNDTVRQLATDDPRLSSYLADLSGELVDVTRVPWEMRGEPGIASTTDDMVRFLKALLVDKTLLTEASLAEMTDFVPTGANEVIDTGFGLGLVKFGFIGGDTFYGFTGGTLGTASSTYLNVDSGAIIAVGATSSEVDTLEGGFNVLQSLDPSLFTITDDGSPLRFMSGAAKGVTLTETEEGLAFAAGMATLTLDRDLRAASTSNVTFADKSVLVVGDNAAGTLRDDRGNKIDILKHHKAAANADNQMIGLGGNDQLRGGHGNDRAIGGTGRDVLWGRGGDDRLSGDEGNDALYGGTGNDRLIGGAGRDILFGGAGADVFVFAAGGDAPEGQHKDTIRDFTSGVDKIDLTSLPGPDDSNALIWRGTGGFSGNAGKVAVLQGRHASTVMVDLTGDGRADLAFSVYAAQPLTILDFLL